MSLFSCSLRDVRGLWLSRPTVVSLSSSFLQTVEPGPESTAHHLLGPKSTNAATSLPTLSSRLGLLCLIAQHLLYVLVCTFPKYKTVTAARTPAALPTTTRGLLSFCLYACLAAFLFYSGTLAGWCHVEGYASRTGKRARVWKTKALLMLSFSFFGRKPGIVLIHVTQIYTTWYLRILFY